MNNTVLNNNLNTAIELLSKAKGSNESADVWTLVDFLYNQCILEALKKEVTINE